MYNTKKEATESWVREFNAVPTDIFNKLMCLDESCIKEVTPPSEYDRVYFYTCPENSGSYNGEIIEYLEEDDEYIIQTDDGEKVTITADDFSVDRMYSLPEWGTMWTFKDNIDKEWIARNIRTMANCGFRIFDTDWGYYFGIDGGGYDFYERHWIPLYDARGLCWHKREVDVA